MPPFSPPIEMHKYIYDHINFNTANETSISYGSIEGLLHMMEVACRQVSGGLFKLTLCIYYLHFSSQDMTKEGYAEC